MGGIKNVGFTGADIKAINVEPEKGEIEFHLKDGRVARKYFKPEHMKLVLDAVKVPDSKLLDLIDKYGT